MVFVDAALEDAGTIRGMPHRDRPPVPRAVIGGLSAVLGRLGMMRFLASDPGPPPKDWTAQEWDVLARLRRSGVRAFVAATRAGSPQVEFFLARNGETIPRIMWPADSEMCATVRAALSPFLTADGDLADTRPATLEAAMQAIDAADPALRRHLRVSRYLAPWIAEARRRA